MTKSQVLLLAFPALSADSAMPMPPPPVPIEQSVQDVVRDAAIAEGVRPGFALDIAWRESRFQPGVVSSEGAMGVMQLMPATAAALGVENPFDPVENIRGAMRWIGALLRQYGSEAITDCIYGCGHPERCLAPSQ